MQIGDDINFKTHDFSSKLIHELQNRTCRDFGIAGPLAIDSNFQNWQAHYLEQNFFHRRHFEIFGYLWPPGFTNV